MQQLVTDNQVTFFRDVLDAMGDLVRVVDDQNRVIHANLAMRRHFGQAQGQQCYAAHSDGPCQHCVVARAICSGYACQKVVECAGRFYSVKAAPLTGMGGPRWAVEVWRDVTQERALNLELRRQNMRMKRDVHLAHSVQISMLPQQLPQPPGYGIHALYKPCEELSGDFYDIIPLGKDALLFYMADVSGHGVAAAMLTVFFREAMRACARPGRGAGQIATAVNGRFCDMELDDSTYITAFIAVLHTGSGRISWTSAGHVCPPLVYSPGGNSQLYMRNLPISAWAAGQRFEDDTFTLGRGDKLLLFTDGVEQEFTRARAQGARKFQTRIWEILQDNPPEESLHRIWQLSGQSSAARDDAAMLLISRDPA